LPSAQRHPTDSRPLTEQWIVFRRVSSGYTPDMSKFVLTVPGTFKHPLQEQARARLLAALQGVDPDEVGTVPETLDLLSVDPDTSTFALRLEVDAADRNAAGDQAQAAARSALRAAGYADQDAPVGLPVVTAIDVG